LGVDVARGLELELELGVEGLAAAKAFPPTRRAAASTATAADLRARR
jgi:hypothetical protein